MRACVILSVALAAAGPARAENPPPERLLPATTQLYLRWDGVPAHRDRYRQVDLGRLLESDLAPLLKIALDEFPRALQREFVDARLLNGEKPDRLATAQADVTAARPLISVLADHGLIVGFEVEPLPGFSLLAAAAVGQALGKSSAVHSLQPRVHATVIVPNAGARVDVVRSALRLQLDGGDPMVPREVSVGGRNVMARSAGAMNVIVWAESGHIVLSVTPDGPDQAVARATASQRRLDAHPLFQRVSEFREFTTDVRGFADLRALLKPARQALAVAAVANKGMTKAVDALGIDGLESVVIYRGFDGSTRREVIEIDTAENRRGVLGLLGGPPLRWDQLPPLPADVSRWSAHRIDLGRVHQLADAVSMQLRDPKSDEDPLAAAIDKFTGINLSSDLLAHLGDVVVFYQSPAEGAFGLGQVAAIRVKDAAKVESAMAQIVDAISIAANIRPKQREYLGTVIHEVHVQNRPGFVFLPSFAVTHGWLVMSLYPQPLQSFIQRAGGTTEAWAPEAVTRERFARLSASSAWSYGDLRPAAQQVLSFAPLILETMRAFSAGPGFDVGALPSASALRQRLSPTVAGFHSDARRLRWDSLGGLILPGDMSGIDPMTVFIAGQILGN